MSKAARRPTLIDQLSAFGASEGARSTLHVRQPEAAAGPAKEQS